jgi:hypothetical protein
MIVKGDAVMIYVDGLAFNERPVRIIALTGGANYNRCTWSCPSCLRFPDLRLPTAGSSRDVLREPDEEGCLIRVKDDALRLTDLQPNGAALAPLVPRR